MTTTKAAHAAEYITKRVHVEDRDYIIEQSERDGWKLINEDGPDDYVLRLTFERAAAEARSNG